MSIVYSTSEHQCSHTFISLSSNTGNVTINTYAASRRPSVILCTLLSRFLLCRYLLTHALFFFSFFSLSFFPCGHGCAEWRSSHTRLLARHGQRRVSSRFGVRPVNAGQPTRDTAKRARSRSLRGLGCGEREEAKAERERDLILNLVGFHPPILLSTRSLFGWF